MAQQVISLGSSPNDGTGTKARAAGDMINDNFTELYPYLAKSPPSEQSGSTYTLALTDAGGTVVLSDASGPTLTIPPNSSVAFDVGAYINVTVVGASGATIECDTAVSLNGATATSISLSQYAGVTLWQRATDEWIVWGKFT